MEHAWRRRVGARRRADSQGFTLLELTLAVAIFAVTIGVAARSLVGFYATMDMQRQRLIAVNHCRAVFSDMRSVGAANPNTSSAPTAFQSAILGMYPHETELSGPYELGTSTVMVEYASPQPTANPLEPTLTVSWNDIRGRALSVRLSTMLTDR